jgi:glycosyltransferase involved in cell wall biosynthesis
MAQEEKALVVSIVIPVYAVSAYIERCINSVMRQTYDCIECLLVDDATPDDSITKCEQLIEEYQGPISFVILHHGHNRGLSASRNTGTKAATGDYIFFLDSDDELKPDCIEKMVKPLRSDPSIEMVLGNHEVYTQSHSEAPTKQRQTHLPQGDYNSKEKVWMIYKKGGCFDGHAWNKLIKRDFLHQHQLYFKEGVMWEDMIWSFITVQYLSHLYIIPDTTLLYYIRPESIMTGTSGKERANHLEIVYEEIAKHFTEGDKGWEAQRNLRGFCSVLIYKHDSPIAQRTARMFLDALSSEAYTHERLYLKTVIFLSKFALGRTVFAIARSTRKAINEKFGK